MALALVSSRHALLNRFSVLLSKSKAAKKFATSVCQNETTRIIDKDIIPASRRLSPQFSRHNLDETIMSDIPAEGIPSERNNRPKQDEYGHEFGAQDKLECDYLQAIQDLNDLQSNNQVLALAKYKNPETILPLFREHLRLAGINVNDLDKLNVVHISGTKGKGSTCAFLERIILSFNSGDSKETRRLKVGSYNSPHLVHVTERIRINGNPIDQISFTSHFRHVFDKLKHATECEGLAMPSYFAFLTILAFDIFLKEQVDCAIIEVGIGGEYDPTNVIRKPVACAITTLDLDHTNILGNSIKSIAWTKAGIIKPGVPMFTVDHEQEEAITMIYKRACQQGSQVYVCKPLRQENAQLGIRGPAQAINASIACQLASYLFKHLKLNSWSPQPESKLITDQFTILETDFKKLPKPFACGLERSILPGRCQMVESERAFFFLDGAHTKKSMENCLEWFMDASFKLNRNANRYLMVNVIGERNKNEVLKPLLPHFKHFDKIIFTSNLVYPLSESNDAMDAETFVKARDTNYEKGFENVKNNARVWMDLVKRYEPSFNHTTQLIIKSSIMESIDDILASQDTLKGGDGSGDKPHILATGSLHFVGATIDMIEKLQVSENADS